MKTLKTSVKTESVPESEIKAWADAYQSGVDGWVKLGEITARLIDTYPDFMDKLCAAHKQITPEFLKRLARVGRHEIVPQLLVASSCGSNKLRQLPYELQEKYVSQPVELLVKTEAGWDTLLVEVDNLTKDQTDQVFDSKTRDVRSTAAQRAFIEDKQVPAVKTAVVPYRIKGGKLEVFSPCSFGSKDLARIMVELA